MMHYKKYDSYKDSGVEWLGKIPETWVTVKLKFITEIVKRIIGFEGPNVLSITQKGIKIKNISSGEGQLAQDYSKYQIVEKGNFAMNHMDLLTGWVDVSKFNGVISPDYRVFKLKSNEFKSEYLLILFQLLYKNKVFYAHGQGVSMLGRWRFPAENFNNFLIPFPSLKEQTAIAAFLDDKADKIDRAIAQKEKLIALLKERKQIIIQNAVTKGLDPNVKLKDSGVEWIGEIPEHWEVTKLKYYTRQIVDGAHFTPTYVEKGIPFLRVTDISKEFSNVIDWTQTKYIPEKEHFQLIKRANPERGDVLLSKNGTIGVTKVIDWDEEFSFFVSLCLLKFTKSLDPYFFCQFFDSPLVDQQIAFGSSRTSVTNLHLEKIKELLIVVPPIEEQKDLSIHLTKINDDFRKVIFAQQTQIEKLKEYKATLIDSAVTGKIKVTGV